MKSSFAGETKREMSMTADVVTLDYQDLINGADLSEQIAQAFGMDGLGLLTGISQLLLAHLLLNLSNLSHDITHLKSGIIILFICQL